MSPDPRPTHGLISLAAVATGIDTMVGVLILPATAGAVSNHASTMVKVEKSTARGSILETGNGKTVYRLTADSRNKSRCWGACAKIWPPVLLAHGQRHPSGVSGLDDFRGSNGTHQVTFKGEPLYTFVGDKAPGQITGDLAGQWGKWWVVNPAHPLAVPHDVAATAGTPPTTGSTSSGTTSTSTATTKPTATSGGSSSSATQPPATSTTQPPAPPPTQPPATSTTQPPAPPPTQPPATTTTTTVPKTTTTTSSGGGIAY